MVATILRYYSCTRSKYPVHVLEKETVYMKNNMEIKITEIKNDSTHTTVNTFNIIISRNFL